MEVTLGRAKNEFFIWYEPVEDFPCTDFARDAQEGEDSLVITDVMTSLLLESEE